MGRSLTIMIPLKFVIKKQWGDLKRKLDLFQSLFIL